ncbi:MAG: hypothetical protein IT265_13590 [Saprospiraceae bacterium]|nr:hypothetical protein [Saprospiraceae bacterium]
MKLIIIIWILIFLNCFSFLSAQNFYKKFDKHLDTTLQHRYNFSMVPMPADKYFLDSVNKFIEISKTNTKQFDQLRSAIETILKLNDIRYSIAYPLFKIYVNKFQESVNYPLFVLKHAFIKKEVTTERLGAVGYKEIYLFNEISEDCKLNQAFKNQILNSNFLKEDYKQVNTESYQLFFKNCNDGLSIDDMIRKTSSKKKKKALKEIKYMIQKDNFNSLNLNTKTVK